MIFTGIGIIDSQKFLIPDIPKVIVGTTSTTAEHKVLITTDEGETWDPYTSSNFSSNAFPYDIIHTGSIWVMVGSPLLTVGTTRYPIAYSYDGFQWELTSPQTNSLSFSNIDWNGSKFLATGAGYRSSPDGITWTNELGLSGLLASISGIKWHDGYWYAGGRTSINFGRIYRSADGVSWELAVDFTPQGQKMVNGLGTNGTRLVCSIGTSGEMWYSDNGTDWNIGSTVNSQGQSILGTRIVWCGSPLNRWVCGGFYLSQTAFKMRQSEDGITWTSVDTSSIFGVSGATNADLIVSNLKWDGEYLWFTRARSCTPEIPGVVFKTSDLITFETVLNYNSPTTPAGTNGAWALGIEI